MTEKDMTEIEALRKNNKELTDQRFELMEQIAQLKKASHNELRVGDLVKVYLKGESLWVKVIKVGRCNTFLGEINNNLVNTQGHGLSFGDRVTFHLVDYGDFKCWEVSPDRQVSEEEQVFPL